MISSARTSMYSVTQVIDMETIEIPQTISLSSQTSHLINRTSPPKMGIQALLTCRQNRDRDASGIVHDIIMNRFGETLDEMCRRLREKHALFESKRSFFLNEIFGEDQPSSEDDSVYLTASCVSDTTDYSDAWQTEEFYKTCLSMENETSLVSTRNETTIDISSLVSHSACFTDSDHVSWGSQGYESASPTSTEFPKTKPESKDLTKCRDQKRNILLQEMQVQLKIYHQTMVLLNQLLVKRTRYVTEETEAERILLLTSHKMDRLNLTLANMEYCPKDETKSTTYGCIQLSEMTFSRKSRNHLTRENECFLCLLSYENDVQISDVFEFLTNNKLSLSKTFRFDNLSPNFDIELQLFSKKRRKKAISLMSGLEKLCQVKNSKMSEDEPEVSHLPTFTQCGKACLNAGNLSGKTIRFENTSSDTDTPMFQLDVSFKLNCKVGMFGTFSGLLEVGERKKSAIKWNLSCCVLEDCVLKYWHLPADGNPDGLIDLRKTVSDLCEYTPRRSRILFLKVLRGSEYNSCSNVIVTYYFTYNKPKELVKWKQRLDSVLQELKKWKHLL